VEKKDEPRKREEGGGAVSCVRTACMGGGLQKETPKEKKEKNQCKQAPPKIQAPGERGGRGQETAAYSGKKGTIKKLQLRIHLWEGGKPNEVLEKTKDRIMCSRKKPDRRVKRRTGAGKQGVVTDIHT